MDLDNNQISDISAISGLTNLKRLGLYNNQISDISAISGLTNLNYLHLSNNQITNINVISGLTKLIRLDLDNNQISNISAISGLAKLKYLYLSDNQISDISVIERLTELTDLDLNSQTIKSAIDKGGIKEVELPQIIKAAKDSNSKIYTEKDYILTNCTLSTDGTKIIIDTDNVNTASIKINEGTADSTIFTIIIEENHILPNVEVEQGNNEDPTIIKTPIPKAGIKTNIIMAILFILMCGVITYRKYSQYKDIK